MKKVNKEMLSEYDLSQKKGVRGKYHKALKNGYSIRVYDKGKIVSTRFLAMIEPDVHLYFQDSKTINKALRSLISLIPDQKG
jgi:hypothetical protein